LLNAALLGRSGRLNLGGDLLASKHRLNLNLLQLMESVKISVFTPDRVRSSDNLMDATCRMAFAGGVVQNRSGGWPRKASRDARRFTMTNSDQTHPLGDEETDQINPAVESGLTPEQLDWLRMQSVVVGRKKLQILRQALFEWVGEHMEYRFKEAGFGNTVRQALDEFIIRHSTDIPEPETENRVSGTQQQ
jgi:hypothetical protein